MYKVNRKNKVQFVESDFQNNISFQIYSKSSFEFYKKANDYYVSLNSHEEPFYIGNTMQDIEDFLNEFNESYDV